MRLTDSQLKQIYTHAAETYPFECCGFLIGTFEPEQVRRVRTATNQNRERGDRFLISGEEFMQAQTEADEAGLDIIGIYHSHPNYPPIPSQTDMDNAWEGVAYLIVSMHERHPLNTRIWHLSADAPRRFQAVPLEIVDENAL